MLIKMALKAEEEKIIKSLLAWGLGW